MAITVVAVMHTVLRRTLANSLSVYHNLFRNREILYRGTLRLLKRAMKQAAERCLEQIGVNIPLRDTRRRAPVRRAALGDRGGTRGLSSRAGFAARRAAGGHGCPRGRADH